MPIYYFRVIMGSFRLRVLWVHCNSDGFSQTCGSGRFVLDKCVTDRAGAVCWGYLARFKISIVDDELSANWKDVPEQ